MRNGVTPAFSLRNLKNVTSHVQGIAAKLVDSLRRDLACGEDQFDFETVCKRFTMDCVGRVTLSMDFGAVENPKDNIVSIRTRLDSLFVFLAHQSLIR